jgi:hypothetical protein
LSLLRLVVESRCSKGAAPNAMVRNKMPQQTDQVCFLSVPYIKSVGSIDKQYTEALSNRPMPVNLPNEKQ